MWTQTNKQFGSPSPITFQRLLIAPQTPGKHVLFRRYVDRGSRLQRFVAAGVTMCDGRWFFGLRTCQQHCLEFGMYATQQSKFLITSQLFPSICAPPRCSCLDRAGRVTDSMRQGSSFGFLTKPQIMAWLLWVHQKDLLRI